MTLLEITQTTAAQICCQISNCANKKENRKNTVTDR